MKIDFVVTWVDGEDPNWIKSKNKYTPKNAEINTDIRYRDYGTFKYWFRAVEKYAPWVNKIYVVTSGHVPSWLNLDNEKIVFVKHSDFIPDKYLPTFSSNPIELNIFRIKELSEHFVLFSDDVFLTKPVKEDDFFHNGLPRDFGVYSPVIPDKEFQNIVFNDVRMINRNFNRRENLKKHPFKFFNYKYGMNIYRTFATLPWKLSTGYWNTHVTSSLLKSTFTDVWNKEQKELDNTCSHKFRVTDDINHWVIKYWQIEQGKFYPQSAHFGKSYTLNQFDGMKGSLIKNKYKVLCINDDYNVDNYDNKMNELMNIFENKFSIKSQYEK